MSENIPLTARQLDTLRELAKPKNRAHYMGYMGRYRPIPYWFISSTMKNATREVEALLSRGLLVHKKKHQFDDGKAFITAKGRALLRRLRRDASNVR